MLKYFMRNFCKKINNKNLKENNLQNNVWQKQVKENLDVHNLNLKSLENIDEDELGESYMDKFDFDKNIRLDTSEVYKDLYLDDWNMINIENKGTYHLVPKLFHKLDHIIQNPGTYHIDEFEKILDDKTKKYLNNIPQPDEIDFSQIPPYLPPSKDKTLLNFAKKSKIKYVMSTSTISSALSQIYFLFSNFKSPDFHKLSHHYINEPKKYMISQRKPITNYIKCIDKKNNVYSMDSDKGIFKSPVEILLKLGKIMERQLTMGVDDFNETLVKNKQAKIIKEIEQDHHKFMKLNNNICLRSQIDCMSTLKKNSKDIVFEIKTRSLCAIRYDLPNYEKYLDYELKNYLGHHSSFEREYYDLIRGAFLKYCFQLKIGRMDGAFICYHNTKKIYGFEYITLKEIERRIFGNSYTSDLVFSISSKLLTTILDYLLEFLKGEKYEYFKLGLYSCKDKNSLIILAELFEEKNDYWKEDDLFEPNNEVDTEYDYYEKILKKKPKVFKFEMKLKVIINGIEQINNLFQIQENDIIDIKYNIKELGLCTFKEYMYFLNEAYKSESINLNYEYSGLW